MGVVRRALVVVAVAASAGCTTMGDVLDALEGTGGGADDSSSGGTEGGAALACGAGEVAWWCPAPALDWQNQRTGLLDYAVAADLYDVPLFTTEASAITTLHGQGRDVICWFSAGVTDWGEPDRDQLIPYAGDQVVPGESRHWLDLAAPVVRDAMLARLDLAVQSGCDAIEPGDMDGWMVETGLPLTRAGTIEFLQWLAQNAHARGLAIALQDGTEIAADVEPVVDFAIDYGCLAAGTCDRLAPFTAAGKVVLHAELIDPDLVAEVEARAPEICAQSETFALVTIFKKPDLNAWLYPCD